MKTKLLLAALMLSMSFSLFAQSGTCGTNLTWTLSSGTLTISGTGAMYSYTSTSTIPWYSSRTSIKTVIIEDGVTSIGRCAFYDCSSLTSITIPNSVTSIGSGVFSGCTSLPIINNIRYADTYLVGAVDKTLSTYNIKKGTIWIGDHAFYDCSSLTSITIPNSVTSIEDYAFYLCDHLTSITIPNSVTSIGEGAFRDCSSLTSITIPNGVTTIGDLAFKDCSKLTSVTIGNSVTSIGQSAFNGCTGLTSVTIGNSVTSIGNNAFSNCSNLKTVTIYAEIPPIAETYYPSVPNMSQTSEYLRVSGSAFYGLTLSNITLYVPTPNLYGMDIFWRRLNIQGIDATDLKYAVTWKNYDGSVLETDENVAAGTIPAYNGATPVKPADEQYTYTFAGWSPAVTIVTGETTYIATFSATFKANTYTIHVNQDCTSYMEEQQ